MAEEDREYHQHRFTVPDDAVEVLLVRHGASAVVRRGIEFGLVDGHSDPPLAPEGERQAERVAPRIAALAPAALYCSPLQRTAQTAAPAAALTGLEPVVVPELREVHLGDWDGGGEHRIRVAARDPIALRSFREERWDVLPGAERDEDFGERVKAGFERILAEAPRGRTVAAFLHGGVIGELCRLATDSRRFAFIHVENASLTRIVAHANGRLVVRTFNETAHLDT